MRTGIHILFIVLLTTGCSSKRVQTQTQVDQGPDQVSSTSTSVSLFGNEAKETLSYASRLIGEGKYAEAAMEYENVYADFEAETEYREKALLGLASVHSHVLNPNRSFETARHYLLILLSEFPETTFRQDAEERLVAVQEFLASQPGP